MIQRLGGAQANQPLVMFKPTASHLRPQNSPTGGTHPSNRTGFPQIERLHRPTDPEGTKEERIQSNHLVLKFKVFVYVIKTTFLLGV